MNTIISGQDVCVEYSGYFNCKSACCCSETETIDFSPSSETPTRSGVRLLRDCMSVAGTSLKRRTTSGERIVTHVEGFSSPWTGACLCDRWNASSRTARPRGLSPAWTRTCRVRLFLEKKASPHTSHQHGLSPTWSRMWTVNVSLRANFRLHTAHAKGLSPVWIRTWVISVLLREKLLPHAVHA